MKKRLLALVFAFVLTACAVPAAADGFEYPVVFTQEKLVARLNMDAVYYELQNVIGYQEALTFGASRFVVTSSVQSGVKHQITLTVTRVDTGEVAFAKTYQNVWGLQFVSDEIETPYTGNRVTQYKVDLTVDGITRSVVVNRELVYLTKNTVCARGLRFRDLTQEFLPLPLTNKWYMFTPVDLYALPMNGGTKTIPLFASNMYQVGSLTLTRQGDFVYVNAYPDADVYLRNCAVTFFPNLSAVSEDLLSNTSMQRNGWGMGTPISLTSNLSGKGCQLLYFSGIIDFDPNTKERLETVYQKTIREEMLELLRTIEMGLDGGVG